MKLLAVAIVMCLLTSLALSAPKPAAPQLVGTSDCFQDCKEVHCAKSVRCTNLDEIRLKSVPCIAVPCTSVPCTPVDCKPVPCETPWDPIVDSDCTPLPTDQEWERYHPDPMVIYLAKPRWLLPVSAFHYEGLAGGVGIGRRFSNNWELLAQGLYGDSGAIRTTVITKALIIADDHRGGPRRDCDHADDRCYRTRITEDTRSNREWGFAATLVIPIGGAR